jgi:hypothetical protein
MPTPAASRISANIANPNVGTNVLNPTKVESGTLTLRGTDSYTDATTVMGDTQGHRHPRLAKQSPHHNRIQRQRPFLRNDL